MTEAEEFEELRIKIGCNHKRLAELLGVSIRAIFYWKSGERPVPEPILRLMRLVVKVDEPGIEK